MKYFKSAAFLAAFNMKTITSIQQFETQLLKVLDNMPLDHVYVESFRSGEFVPEETLNAVIHCLKSHGIKVSGGITFTDGLTANGLFDTFCYSAPDAEDKIRRIVRYTAQHFDEIILDDFFFTHCKCPNCIKQKGTLTWEEFRLNTMKKVGAQWVIEEAKKANPQVKVILKYPNWYAHYQASGYNLELAELFDGIYAGTETRDPVHTQQNLPRYNSYFIMQLLNQVAPGKLLGGWFDSYDCLYQLNSIVEQAILTILGGGKEICFFNLGDLMSDAAIAAPLLKYTYERMDQYIEHFTAPLGLITYRPHHASGEDYLEGYLGMMGVPFAPHKEYPKIAPILFLSLQAAKDPLLLSKMKEGLYNGQKLIITRALADKLLSQGFDELLSYEPSNDKALVSDFARKWEMCSYAHYGKSSKPILMNALPFMTNDAQNLISGLVHESCYPLLLKSHYAKGELYILNVPDTFGQLYHLPYEAASALRTCLLADAPIIVHGKCHYMVFPFEGNYFALYALSVHSEDFEVIIKSKRPIQIMDLETGQVITPLSSQEENLFKLHLFASSFKMYQILE